MKVYGEMEVSTSSIALTLVFITVLLLLWKLAELAWLTPKRLEKYLKQQGLQGTRYKLLVGDSKSMFSMRRDGQTPKPLEFSNDYFPRIFPFIYETIQSLGKNSFMWLGPYPIINVTEPGQVKEVLTNIYDFQKLKMGSRLLTPGLLSEEGAQWASHRKTITPAFHISKLKLLLPSLATSCIGMLNKWEKNVDNTGSFEIDVWPYLENLTAETISRVTFGDTFDEGRVIFELIDEQISLIAEMRKSKYVPGSRFLPTRANRRMSQTSKEIQKLLGGLISARKKALEAGQTSTKADLLSSVLESTSDQKQLIDDCKLFYLAGKDSTARLMVWTIILLSKHQDWQDKARDEILRTFGPDNQPNFEGLNNLKIVTMILNEVLRLYPPVPVLVRSIPKQTKLGNISLPAGSLVTLPFALVQHDNEVWGEDAKMFNPERFSQGISNSTRSGKPSLLAFSAGPRICLGQNLALLQAKLTIAMILQRFSLEVSPSYVHAPYFTLVLEPQFGAPILLRRI